MIAAGLAEFVLLLLTLAWYGYAQERDATSMETTAAGFIAVIVAFAVIITWTYVGVQFIGTL